MVLRFWNKQKTLYHRASSQEEVEGKRLRNICPYITLNKEGEF